jgi:TonB family protein
MTSASRRAMPWLISAGAHLGALSVMALVLTAPAPLPVIRGLDVSLVEGSIPGPGGSPPSRGLSRTRPVAPAPPEFAPAHPQNAYSGPSPAAVPPSGEALSRKAPQPSPLLPTRVPTPSAGDVLQDVAAVAAGPGGEPQGVANGFGGSSWGWQGQPRRLIRKRDPEFPAVLSAAGQEIEGEARITVAPSGTVTRVEITRSSGYIEIDASVEAALRDYLFSRVDGTADTVGTVQFRFRLEKQD